MRKLLIATLLISLNGFASDLENELESLNMPSNMVPKIVSKEKLYSIQTRHNDLKKNSEVSFSGGTQVMGDGHLNTNNLMLGYQYGFNQDWAAKLTYSKYFNELNSAGRILLEQNELVPDKDFKKSSWDISARYNLFYGKFRLNMDKVFYFDHFITAGAGMATLNSGTTPMLSLGTGLAFWMGKSWNMKVGFKDEIYEEVKATGETTLTQNYMTYLEVGYLFGQSN